MCVHSCSNEPICTAHTYATVDPLPCDYISRMVFIGFQGRRAGFQSVSRFRGNYTCMYGIYIVYMYLLPLCFPVLQVSSWGGYVFLINLIPIHVLALMVTGRFSHRIYVAYCTVRSCSKVLGCCGRGIRSYEVCCSLNDYVK